MVIWIIGMSASGKTTLGKELYERLLLSNEKWLFIDGDTFRNILGEDLGHTIEDRKRNAYRISRFCEFLSSSGVNVLACVLSLFHDNQKYNKENIKDYKEIFLDVSFDKLVQRDNKELYKKAIDGDIKNVVGVDIKFNPPYSPDIIIDNNKDNPNYEKMVSDIIETFDIVLNNEYSYTKNNLLDNPHKYQYSKFLGEQFFNQFNEDRDRSIKYLDNKLIKLKNANISSPSLDAELWIVDNNIVLKNFLIYLFNGSLGELNKHKKTIALLIKRFEVGKKLYRTYNLQEVRKNSIIFDDLLNYPLFSLVLQKYYNNTRNEEKLIYLNAILKCNDIISSIKTEFLLYDEIYYAIDALRNELIIVSEYL